MPDRPVLAAAAALLAALPAAALAGPTPSSQSGTVRVSAADRYATSAAVAGWAFAPTAGAVFITSGTAFPDALSAGTAAARVGGPLLLVGPTTLPAPVASRLKVLRPSTIYVVGGTGAVSASVERALGAYGRVQRIAGPDRYATAAVVSRSFAADTGGTVYLGSGESFADALAGSPAAARQKAPMLLTSRTGLPRTTRDEIARAAPSRVVVLGGTGSVSASVLAAVKVAAPRANIVRVSGADRYATAAAVAAYAWPSGSTKALVASGTGFADGLSAAPAARVNDAPLLLTNATCRPAATVNANRRFGTRLTAYVGSPAVAASRSCAQAPAPTPTPTPTPKPTPTSAPVPPRPSADKDCSDFPSRAAAQAEFDALYPYYGDVYRLDVDHDMRVCESMK